MIERTHIGRSGYLLTAISAAQRQRRPEQRERTRRYDQNLPDPQPRAGTKWIKNLGGEIPPEPVSEDRLRPRVHDRGAY
jgi:hypothetical protein